MGPPIFFGNAGAIVPGVVAFWLTFYAWVLSEMWLGWRRRPPRAASAQDRGSRWVVIAGVWSAVVLGISLASAARTVAFTAGRPAILVIGIVLMIAGLVLRWSAIRMLGRSFTVDVATQSGQPVIDRGPYRWVRHPSYSGSLLTVVGVLLACANPLAFIGLIPALIAYAFRIRVEEQVLSKDLGEPYRAYMRRTRRLIPFVL
jgi:protein-S-isoprenylcysteine O-methyltransferase Ste14